MNFKYLFITITFVVSFFSCQNSSGQNEKEINSQNDTTIASIINKDTLACAKSDKLISIIGVGDIMLGTNYPKSPNYLPPNKNCEPLLKDVKPILLDADLTFGNCEGVFSDPAIIAMTDGTTGKVHQLGGAGVVR